MNINAATTTHIMLASTVERTIKGIRMFYDTDLDLAMELMRPIIVLGKPGIGKTVALRELAQKKLKIGYKELRLASMSELDLAGLPMVKQSNPDPQFLRDYLVKTGIDVNEKTFSEYTNVESQMSLDAKASDIAYKKCHIVYAHYLIRQDEKAGKSSDPVLQVTLEDLEDKKKFNDLSNYIADREAVVARSKADLFTSETTYASSKLLPKASRDGEYGILVLDEISSCSRSARAVALQLLDSSRGVGEYKLPDKWICVGLGNDADDGGIFEGLEGAFLNRCRCMRLEPDYASWEIWADARGLNSTVMAFLKCYPELFYVDPIEGDNRICASPRAWQGVATQLDFAETLSGGRIDSGNTEMFIASIASDITPEIAARLAAFYAYNAEMINPDEVLSGKAKLNGKDAGAKESIYLTIESCIALLIKRTKGVEVSKLSADLQSQIGNFIRFTGQLQASKGGEAAVSALEQLLKRVPIAVGLLSGASFKKDFPDEYKLLVFTASKLTGISNSR